MKDLLFYLLADVLCLIACAYSLRGFLSVWHPLTHYLFYHGYAISLRGWRLFDGATPMYGEWSHLETVRDIEIIRAIIYSDIALVFFTLGSFVGHHRSLRLRTQTSWGFMKIDPTIFRTVVWFCFPIGTFAFLTVRFGESENTFASYYAMVAFWPIACLCMAMFFYGFKPYLVIPASIYLAIVGLQGFHRFMLFLPLLFLATLYLQRHGRKWPGPLGWAFCFFAVLVFPEWKEVGRTFLKNGVDAAVKRASVAFSLEREGERVEDLLDQLAGALTMFDRQGKLYFGRTYFYAVTLPIPRSFWSEKPAINQHVVDVTTRSRPYRSEGRIITMTGESYANFGIAGVILVSFVVGYALTIWCVRSNQGEFLRVARYVYLVFMITFIQVFRDGLTSFAMFGIFQNIPMVLLLLLHWQKGKLAIISPSASPARTSSL